jgi:hypothetical protein
MSMTFTEAQIAAKRLAGDNATICFGISVWVGETPLNAYSISAFYGSGECEGGYGDSWEAAMADLTRKWNARTITATVESADVAAMTGEDDGSALAKEELMR